MKTDVIVHVGYRKTATSWLQEKIFNELGEEIYLGKRESAYPEWLLKMSYLDDFAYLQQREALRGEIAGLISGKERVIISSEAFTNFSVIHQQIERIDYFFEHPRIILVLRHPVSWLLSNYKYYVEYERFCCPLESYLDFGERRTPFCIEKRRPFYLPDLFYDEVVGHYRQVFGEGNVLVLRYEDFVADPGLFGNELASFIGMPLPAFEEKAKQKVLVSRPEKEIDTYRTANMTEFIRNADFEVSHLATSRMPDEILSAETRDRLRQFFLPHCRKFYPELAVAGVTNVP